MLKLTRLPRGTNRNRMRRMMDFEDEELSDAEIEDLFRKFWKRRNLQSVPPETEGEGSNR